LLAVSGSDLTQADTQAVSAFANQAAVALLNARLYQEVQGWAAELEQRVEERTAELAVSEARYRRLFDSNRDGLYVVDMQGHCLDANPAACQMLGYNREELLALDVYQIGSDGEDLSPEGRSRFLERLQPVLRDTVSGFEAELIRKDGEQVPVELSMTPLVFGGREAALASVRDITQRKQAEEELRASREQLKRLARQLVSAQEDERKRLAHALHDEAGQALTALKIGLELMSQDLEEPCAFLRPRMDDAVSLTDQTTHRIRLLAQDLRPPALDSLGLSHTLEGFCREFAQRTRLGVDYQGTDLPQLPEEVNITLYRFLQEAMTNVARHARANEVDVALQSDAEAIRLSVEDDGRGFDLHTRPATHGRPQGMGLLGMQERVESLGGRLEVVSEPGQGTRLTACIPLKAA
jgi:PAS domain S-box-containing protein